MTEAQFTTFVKGHLRRASRWWKPISEVVKEARVGRGLYLCAGCKNNVPNSIVVNNRRVKNIFCDHVDPVVSLEEGFTGWDDYVERLFCEKQNLQVLCKHCHEQIKSKDEKKLRSKYSSLREAHLTTYKSWSNMNSRCYVPSSTGYEHYGERGITVQDSWRRDLNSLEGFVNFLSDMGAKPENTTLERVDVNKSYSKENCRWASWKDQGNNKTDNHWVSYNGEVLTVSQWAERLDLLQNTILYRLRRGWPVGQALGLEKREKPNISRLSKDTWLEVQKLRDEGYTTTQLGEMFGIDPSQISRKTLNKTAEERLLAKNNKKDNNELPNV